MQDISAQPDGGRPRARAALRTALPTALLALAVAVAGAPGAVQASDKPLVFCAEASPEGFDPALWDSSATSNATSQIFNRLLGYRRGTSDLQPELATAWQVSPDARSVTITLRRDVVFHSTPSFTPTRALNADDVLFSFQRMLDPQHPFHLAFPATYVQAQSLGLPAMVAGIDRIDGHTLRFRLHRPNVNFLSLLASNFASIHSAEYAAQLLATRRASAINNQPVGTGPWRFKSYRKDDVLRLQPHPGHWRGVQKPRALVFAISREPNVRVQKLARGECQIAAAIRDVDVTSLTGHPQVQILKTQALNISYLAFNLQRPLLARREVREALDIAIDRNALFRVLFPRGDALQAVSAFPPSVPGFNTRLRNEYNPVRARTLLAQAGVPPGTTIDLWALPISRPTNPNGQLMAQLVQADWAQVGITARIRSYEWGEYLKRANNGEHDVYMSGWSSDVPLADDFLAPNLSCASSRGGIKFCHAEFDALLQAAREEVDVPKRLALIERAQEIFKRERPWITMAHSSIYIPLRKDVRGFVMAPDGSVDFEGVWRE